MPSEPKNRPLGERRKKFIAEYLKTLNASQAARNAGYKGRSDVAGARLLVNDKVRAEVSRRIAEAMGSEKDGLRRRIVNELQSEAFATSEDKDENGNLIVRPSANKIKALELLAKYAKLLDDTPIVNNINIPIQYLPESAKE